MIERIWVVSELYYPEETSTGYFLTKIAEGLAQNYPVEVLCGQPTYSARGITAPWSETHNEVTIQRCHATTLDKDILPFRILNLLTISFSIFIQSLLRFRKSDVVIVVTNPPLLPFVILASCALHRSRCMLLIHDVYPEVLIAARLTRQGSLVARGLAWVTRSLYRSTQGIIVLGRDMQRLVASKLGAAQQRTVIIPNWADLDEIIPKLRSDNSMLRRLGLMDKFVVQYSGNMGGTHGLESLLAGVAKLKNDASIHFLFIGSGAKKYWLEEQVSRQALLNITVLPPQPRSELVDSLNACDIAVISFIPGMVGISVPSRMYNILAAGKPLIAVADPGSELALVVQEERVGWVIPPDDPDELVRVILKAQASPDLLAAMRTRARLAAERYSLEQVIQLYRTAIKDIDNGS